MGRGLFDNDIFIKLAGCGLIDDARQYLGIQESWVLSSLKPQLNNTKKRGKLAQYFASLQEDTQRHVLSALDQVQSLPPPDNQALIDRYVTEHNLDLGELQLLEAALRLDDTFLITGDKRFLKQLAETSDLLALALEKLSGRFACLESVLLLLMESKGFEFVQDKVLPAKEYDGVIRNAFGRTEEHAREALMSEIRHLGDDVARLLHYPLGNS